MFRGKKAAIDGDAWALCGVEKTQKDWVHILQFTCLEIESFFFSSLKYLNVDPLYQGCFPEQV